MILQLKKKFAKALLDAVQMLLHSTRTLFGHNKKKFAEEAGAFSIGYNTDMKAAAPGAYMTAPIWNWGPYYVAQVQAVIDGNWKAESYWGGMADEIVALAPLTELAPAEGTLS